jgi:hypothetical protein
VVDPVGRPAAPQGKALAGQEEVAGHAVEAAADLDLAAVHLQARDDGMLADELQRSGQDRRLRLGGPDDELAVRGARPAQDEAALVTAGCERDRRAAGRFLERLLQGGRVIHVQGRLRRRRAEHRRLGQGLIGDQPYPEPGQGSSGQRGA